MLLIVGLCSCGAAEVRSEQNSHGSVDLPAALQSVETRVSVESPASVEPTTVTSSSEKPFVLLDSRVRTHAVRQADVVMGDGVRMFPESYKKAFPGDPKAGVCQRGKRVPWVIAEVPGSFLKPGADEEIVLIGEHDCAQFKVYESLGILVRRENATVRRAPWLGRAYLLGAARTTRHQLDELLVNWGPWWSTDGNLGMLFWRNDELHEAFRTTWATRYGCDETPPVATQGLVVRAYLGEGVPRFEEELWIAECRADERSPLKHEYHLAETRALEVTDKFKEYALEGERAATRGGEDGS